ncbi:MAG: hypothetical protein GEU86_07580 [Actinophytocola sp.]|nr:hypothetical protein [Actinophytocola sp.]
MGSVEFFTSDAAGDRFNVGCGQLSGSVSVYGLVKESAHERGRGDSLICSSASQLGVEASADPNMERDVERGGVFCGLGLSGFSFLGCYLCTDGFVAGAPGGPGVVDAVGHFSASFASR